MAPTKSSSTRTTHTKSIANPTLANALLPLARKGLTRRTTQNIQDQNVENMQTRGKRKAEHSPLKNEKVKRSALGNLTNNGSTLTITNLSTLHSDEDAKHEMPKRKDNQLQASTAMPLHVFKDMQNMGHGPTTRHQQQQQLHQMQQQMQRKIATRAATRNAAAAVKVKVEDQLDHKSTVAAAAQPKKEPAVPAAPAPAAAATAVPMKAPTHKPVRRISNEFNKTEDSLYMSALEDVSSSESIRFSGNFEAAKRRSALLQLEKLKAESNTIPEREAETTSNADGDDTTKLSITASTTLKPAVPDGVDDFDKANWNDPFQVSHYAIDIFQYLKERECEFPITDYMEKQVHLSKWMRSLLVDWMVEVQETFELNHETLYLAVKIVDLYLCRVVINKEKLQLLGAAALFIACKFDERTPPLIEDFLYICDGAYKHNELIQMEMAALRTIDYDLGIPLSYRFLRRYSRCAKVPMPTLTLARYILELSLMDYGTITLSDSKLACAVLFMALRLHGEQLGWTPTLEYYSGYKLADFAEIVPFLNAGMHRKPKGTIKTIRSKYSHKIFHEVAKVPLQTTEKLFEHNLDLNVSIQAAIDGQQQQQDKH